MPETKMNHAASDPPTPPDVAPVIAAMCLVIGNTMAHRWLSPFDQADATRVAFRRLTEWFGAAGCGELYLRHLVDRLEAADQALDMSLGDVAPLAGQMEALDLRGLVVQKEIAEGEFKNFLEILSAEPDELLLLGGFQSFAAKIGVTHVVVRNIVLREVAEDDIVVRKARFADVVANRPGGHSRLLDFLRSTGGEATDAVREALESAQDDCEGVGALLLETAKDAPDAGLALGDAVRRAFECWSAAPAARTQKGKKELARFVGRLQNWLTAQTSGTEGAADALNETFDAIGDELKMDAMTAEYLRRRRAISESESRILRYIHRKGREGIEQTDLEQRLMEGGLQGGDWRDLLVKSGVAGSGGPEATVRRVASRLLGLEDALRSRRSAGGAVDPGKLTQDLKQIAVDVDALVVDTGRKVQDIIDEYRQDAQDEQSAEADAAGPEAKKRGPSSRKALYEKLSEIGQELCQPLAVINCSISMITSGRLGGVTGTQADVLNLATESVQKLQKIVDSLMRITGVPQALEPNAEIQSNIYA